MASQGKLKITWIKSAIGYKQNQKATIAALGFHKLWQVIEQEDSPQIRGMLFTVRHLVTWEPVQSTKGNE
jgi:large subunit ribosomal protein L30